ncbi:MAG: diguanylate cyclase, partial [Burkholderiales bacterium]
VVLSDLSGQVTLERRIKQTDSWLAAIYSGVNDFAFFSLDSYGRIDTWNQSGTRHTGYGVHEALGSGLDLFYHTDENLPGRALEHIQCARQDGWHLEESWCANKEGTRYWGQILVAALTEDNGEINGYSVVLRDISERKLSGEKLKSMITTDHLTGATSRAHFFDVAEAEVARWTRYGRALSIIMIDVDFFKAINDTFGHLTGDRVLQMLVRHCRILLRTVDVVARLGGEEFAVLLPSTDELGATEVAERIRRVVQDLRFETDAGESEFTVSLGCATMGGTIDNVTQLLAAADDALYRATKAGRLRCIAYSDR